MLPKPRPVSDELRVAVLIPCPNEAASIEAVVQDVRGVLPAAEIYVYDNNNNSTDDTAARAAAAGAIVRRERLQGKGNVVRRMFAALICRRSKRLVGSQTRRKPRADLIHHND